MSSGVVVEIIGAVVDVQFPHGKIPKVYEAVRIESAGLTMEVQQQLGDGVGCGRKWGMHSISANGGHEGC